MKLLLILIQLVIMISIEANTSLINNENKNSSIFEGYGITFKDASYSSFSGFSLGIGVERSIFDKQTIEFYTKQTFKGPEDLYGLTFRHYFSKTYLENSFYAGANLERNKVIDYRLNKSHKNNNRVGIVGGYQYTFNEYFHFKIEGIVGWNSKTKSQETERLDDSYIGGWSDGKMSYIINLDLGYRF